MEFAAKVNAQCVVFDVVFDIENVPPIVEISYGFAPSAYEDCKGYWDITLNFHVV